MCSVIHIIFVIVRMVLKFSSNKFRLTGFSAAMLLLIFPNKETQAFIPENYQHLFLNDKNYTVNTCLNGTIITQGWLEFCVLFKGNKKDAHYIGLINSIVAEKVNSTTSVFLKFWQNFHNTYPVKHLRVTASVDIPENILEAVVRGCSVQKVFLEICKSQRKTPVPESLF